MPEANKKRIEVKPKVWAKEISRARPEKKAKIKARIGLIFKAEIKTPAKKRFESKEII